MERVLDGIERLGNKVPNPVILFLALCGIVIVLSQVLYWANVKATYEVVVPPATIAHERYDGGTYEPSEELQTYRQDAKSYHVETHTTSVQGLLTGEGVRFLFTSFVSNFRNFAPIAIILVLMIGVGLAETAGLIGALIRRLVAISPPSTLTYIIVFLGVLSSIASDAGYLVLIPLGAAAYKSVGRHPLAGMAAAFAGVAAGFGVNFLITPLDGVLVEITNDAAGLANVHHHIDLVSNLYFGIGSTILVTIVAALVSARFVEPRLGVYDPSFAGEGPAAADEAPAEAPEQEKRGLRYALWAMVGVLIVVALLTVIPGAPLRNPETGKIIGDSPFMDSLIVIITIVFFAAGLAYGRGAGTLKSSGEAIEAITKSWAGLAGLLLVFLLIAQFIAYFNFSHMPEVAASQLADVLETLSIGDVWLLVGAIIITAVVGIIIPAAIAKWAILAPIFVPLFIRLGIAPQTVLAAYRVGDSPVNVITPLMPYFPLIVVFGQRYDKRTGIGTVISMMLPYAVALLIVWTVFFAAWFLLGIPLGPGAPVKGL
jgi:aminobenzoyl-glutamate transport protein